MLILILGLVLFLGAHSTRIFVPQFRDRVIAERGENAWKGPYTVASLAGFALIIWGFSMARYEGPILYTPPVWMSHIALLVMLLSFISLAVFGMPAGKLKAVLKHPMIVSVKLWAFAHLLANGDLASLLLFGSFLVWGIVDRISLARRDRAGQTQAVDTGPVRNDIMAALAGFVLYLAFVWKLHEWLIGVPPVVIA
ncbi:NnrU family protein [Hoeflea prorocentri]|uniref:NnrU family protein n=1 Tax=Hoeflea prorocentri TaxID=1922333 RepID=A0A9X3UJD1_9HYPH|nr:NnrU family protein [Hoeflea prorocentri]MCY6381729.1 NnrU family protein [Hoeflea prorocentri]MDA5399529.1 NnrU family protein [Hoeflea prorocentri]